MGGCVGGAVGGGGRSREGIADLGRHNIFVDFLPGEFDNETDNEASMWKSQALRTVLARDPAFKVVPAPSTSTEHLFSACDPSACPESGRQWHVSLGLKEGTWSPARAPPDVDLGMWNDRVFRELEHGWVFLSKVQVVLA